MVVYEGMIDQIKAQGSQLTVVVTNRALSRKFEANGLNSLLVEDREIASVMQSVDAVFVNALAVA
jgi:hypothetical protein